MIKICTAMEKPESEIFLWNAKALDVFLNKLSKACYFADSVRKELLVVNFFFYVNTSLGSIVKSKIFLKIFRCLKISSKKIFFSFGNNFQCSWENFFGKFFEFFFLVNFGFRLVQNLQDFCEKVFLFVQFFYQNFTILS